MKYEGLNYKTLKDIAKNAEKLRDIAMPDKKEEAEAILHDIMEILKPLSEEMDWLWLHT